MSAAAEPFYADEAVTIYAGDCRDILAALEPESVQCVVTSPPYYGLRDYGIPPTVWGGDPEHVHEWTVAVVACPCGAWQGVLGLEPSPDLYVEHITEVFRAVRRVLRKDGTVWLNLGDSYAMNSAGANYGWTNGRTSERDKATIEAYAHRPAGIRAKNRLLMPARVALALQADGWWLRDEVVWAKPNPMPSSVGDRTTPAHEMVYLLTRSARYHYDAAAIAEPAGDNTHDRGGRDVPAGWNDASKVQGRGRGARTAANNGKIKVPGGWMVGPGTHATIHPDGRTAATYRESTLPGKVSLATERQRVGLNGRWDASEEAGTALLTRNKRSVWTVATAPYPEAHFATFPPKLVEPMILAGVPKGGIVLDPFGGSGTIAMVARLLGRRAILIDLNPDYLAQAIKRSSLGLADPGGAFADDGLWAIG